MSESTVAVVGSGIAGTIVAYLLTRRGYDVAIFEKGPEYPYPHLPQFRERILYGYDNPAYRLPVDLMDLTLSGNYPGDPNTDRHMVVGGSATQWGAVTLRMGRSDFRTRTLYGYGENWPLTYEELEPHYCEAEYLLGVSGSDTDNALAPWRSRPYPLPPFALSYDDRILTERLRTRGIVFHTTPQARTRLPYEQRPGCLNYGTCEVCPIGVRYSPNFHLLQALETGRCKLHANTSTRRIVLNNRSGLARALVYRLNDAARDEEHNAKVIIIAAGAIESARLLLLSSKDRHPDGLAHGGHVGANFMFHHLRAARLRYRDVFTPGSAGPVTAMCSQFLDPRDRGRHGGVRVMFSPGPYLFPQPAETSTASEIIEHLRQLRHWRSLELDAESAPSAKKYLMLSARRDRFGDPFAHVHYESSDFDHETYQFARRIFDEVAAGTDAIEATFDSFENYSSSFHHMGACRMGVGMRDSVADRFGKVHGTANLFVIGGSNFASSVPVNPTLTIVALAIRAVRYIIDQVL